MKESSDPKKWFHRDLRWGHSRSSKISFDFYYEAAKFVSSGTLLDIGAGPRTYAPFFKQALYIALEHVDSGLSAKSITDSDIFVDSNEIPLRDNCVTGVLSSSSLEHFRDPELFFSESYRVLEPGGGLFVHAPFLYEEHETPHHYKHFTRYGIKDQLERNGYVGISVKPSSASLPAAMYLSRIAVEDDLGVYSPNTNSINRPLRRLHSGIAKILIAGVFYFVSFGKQDREPHSGTRMPIGWVVKAFKPEEPRWKRERRLSKVTDFLVANSAASQNYEISKGALRPRS